MKLMLSIFAILFSVSTFANGWVDVKATPSKLLIVPDGSIAGCSKKSQVVSGPYSVINSTSLQYNGTGSYFLSYASLKIADPGLYQGNYSAFFAGDELAHFFGSLSFKTGDVRETQCSIKFGEIEFEDNTQPINLKGELKFVGTEVEADGTQNVIESIVPLEFIYLGKSK